MSILIFISGCASDPSSGGRGSDRGRTSSQNNWSAEALNAFNQGVGYLNNDNESARVAFSNAIQLAPAMEAAYFNLARLELNENNLDAAENISTLAQQNHASSARLFNLSGSVKRRQADFKAAKTAYLKALDLKESYTPALLNIAILHDVYLGEMQVAQKYYEQYQRALKTQGQEDNRLKNWLTDLQRRIKKQTGATP